MSKKVRCAVIGTSSIAKAHIHAFQQCPQSEITHICSRSPERGTTFAHQFHLQNTISYQDILDDKTIEAVDIVTEPDRHAHLALAALKSGKHVLIEKPLDTDLSQAQSVLNESVNSQSVVSVISQKRFDPVLQKMHRLIQNGDIGDPVLAEVKLLWHRDEEYYKAGGGWRGQYGNVVMNQGAHWLDVAVWFFGTPDRVHCTQTKVKQSIEAFDTANVSLGFPKNISFNMFCTTAMPKNFPEEFVVYGTKGSLSYQKLRRKRFLDAGFVLKKIKQRFKASRTGQTRSLIHDQVEDFVHAIIDQRAPAVTIQDAYTVLEIIKQCEKS